MKVPDRWNDYTNMGNRVQGTRFVCFKVPLRRHDCGFVLRDLTDYCPDLGIVIDLTNTSKYYDPRPLSKIGIEYKKIFTEGKVLPSNSVVREFFDVVNKFLEDNTENDKVVGVHCTHGLNRTGYLVCRYMVQMLDVAPDQAITDFNSARGHEQERTLYLDDLRLAAWQDEDPLTYVKLAEEDNHGASNKRRRSDHGAVPGSLAGPSPRHTYFYDEEPTPGAALDSSVEGTPRGTKRAREADDCVLQWEEDKAEDATEDKPAVESMEVRKRRYKQAMNDAAYADTDRYDPYFYQQRTAGGKSRRRSAHGPPGKAREEDGKGRKYRGARRPRSPEKEDADESLGLTAADPLDVQDTRALEDKFLLETPPVTTEAREKKTPALFSPEELDLDAKTVKKTVLFSPETDRAAPEEAVDSPAETGAKRRKSKIRYEPY